MIEFAPVLVAVEGSIAGPLALALIGIGAFTLPLIAGRLLIPAIVLEIVFGAVIGPDVLGLIEPVDREAIAILAELGLLLIMFLAGFEVDFERLERRGGSEIAFGLGVFVLILGASWIGAGLLEIENNQQRAFVALLISAASVGIVIPALRDTRMGASRLGQMVLITAVLAEFLALTGIIVLGVLVEDGFGWQLLSIPALFGIMGVILLLTRYAAWWYPERFERLFSHDDPQEMGIRTGLALLFVFVGISLALGIEAILGAFLAGALFAYVFRETGTLEERLRGFAFGFFIPIFFINVGIGFPVRRLGDPEVLSVAFSLVAVAILVKIIPSLVFVFRRFSFRASLAAGVLLAGQLSVVIALAELGLDLELLTPELEAGAVLLVAVTAIFSPIFFRLLVANLERPAQPGAPAQPAVQEHT